MTGLAGGLDAAPIHWFDELDSTNAQARRLAEAGEAGPLWLAALRQTQGRGRRGRAWSTNLGNLAATLLATTTMAPAKAAELSFVAAFAVRDLACAFVPESLVRFKWPNDVLLDGGKLSGILVESGRAPDGSLWLAVGIGVNLAAAPDLPEIRTACLASHLKAEALSPPAPREAMALLAHSLAHRAGAWSRQGIGGLRQEWLANAIGIGGPCTARLGSVTLEGVAEDLDAEGALLLRLASGEVKRITAGDVFFGTT